MVTPVPIVKRIMNRRIRYRGGPSGEGTGTFSRGRRRRVIRPALW